MMVCGNLDVLKTDSQGLLDWPVPLWFVFHCGVLRESFQGERLRPAVVASHRHAESVSCVFVYNYSSGSIISVEFAHDRNIYKYI